MATQLEGSFASIRSGALVLLLGIAVYAIVSALFIDAEDVAQLNRISPTYLVLAVLLALTPWLINSLRLLIWLRFIGVRSRLWDAAQVVLGSAVGAAVSPSAVGGAPVKAALLARLGVSMGHSVTLTSLGSLEDALVAVVALPVALLAVPWLRVLPLEGILNAWPWGVAFLAALVLSAVIFQRLRRALGMHAFWMRLERWLAELRELYASIIRQGKGRLLLNVVLSCIQWMARYSVITALAWGMGLEVDPVLFGLLQWLCFVAMALVPTPGAVGGAEAAFLLVYRDLIPAEMIVLLMGAWRVLSFYFLNMTALAILAVLRAPAGWRSMRRLAQAGRVGST